MNPKSLSLHKKARAIVKNIKTGYCDMIDVLEEILINKSYFDFNKKKAFDYVTEKLELSKAQTSACLRVTRKSLLIPRLKEEIRAGRVDFWKAVKICSVINKENQDHWIALAQSSSKANLEMEIAKTSPQSAFRDRATLKMMGEEVWYKLTYAITKEEMEDFKRCQDLFSQKLGRNASFRDITRECMAVYLKGHDPLRKPARPRTKNESDSKRRPLRTTVKRQVHHQNSSQCSYIDESGARCQERRFLHIHHRVPLSKGGTNHIDNLVILCSGHHRMHHHQEAVCPKTSGENVALHRL